MGVALDLRPRRPDRLKLIASPIGARCRHPSRKVLIGGPDPRDNWIAALTASLAVAPAHTVQFDRRASLRNLHEQTG